MVCYNNYSIGIHVHCCLKMNPRKPIKGIGRPDKNPEKLELENVGDERKLDVLEKRPCKPENVEATRVQRVQYI